MRILLTSDIHGSGHAVKLMRVLKDCYDMALICGDVLPKFVRNSQDLLRIQRLWFERVFLPLMEEINGYFILGNDDWIEYNGDRKLEGFVDLDGLKVFAYEYVPPTGFGTNREKSEDEIWSDLKDVKIEDPFILITHAPPNGILDRARGRNLGSISLRNFVFRERPFLHCFGHIHESFGDTFRNGVRFVNASFESEMRFYMLEISGRSFNLFFV